MLTTLAMRGTHLRNPIEQVSETIRRAHKTT